MVLQNSSVQVVDIRYVFRAYVGGCPLGCLRIGSLRFFACVCFRRDSPAYTSRWLFAVRSWEVLGQVPIGNE